MADNFLEKKRLDYEERKAAWLKSKKHFPKSLRHKLQKPDDEAL